MKMITSRSNACIMHFRKLASDKEYRYSCGEYLCDGWKLLEEAITFRAKIGTILWKGSEPDRSFEAEEQIVVPADLFDYVSPMKNSPGPLFSVHIPKAAAGKEITNAIVLENVQDPGNVGTVIRTANAFGIDAVILVDACADCYSPKTVRSSMGAIFRQRIEVLRLPELGGFLRDHSLRLYGAALSESAADIRGTDFRGTAVAVGSEGSGLSKEILELCEKQIIIPMDPDSESLNAAVAAAVILWEIRRMEI